MKVIVTGSTGFIGQRLVAALLARGDRVVALTRSTEGKAARALAAKGAQVLAWSARPGAREPWCDAIDGADAVVNLAGESVMGKRWDAAHKQRVLQSRLDAAKALESAIEQAKARPKVVVSASAVGYYGFAADERLDENAPAGSDFLARVCVDWEAGPRRLEALGARVVTARIGIVLGEDGGALAQMLLPFKLGAGGRVGDGRQWMSWIHVDDVVGLLLFALDRDDVRGALNVTAPEPARNAEFTKVLGRVLRRPTILPVPAFGLRALFGEAADVMVQGQRVVPAKALALGYRFARPELEGALREAVR